MIHASQFTYQGWYFNADEDLPLPALAEEAVSIARRMGVTVYFTFQDTLLQVRQGVSVASVLQQWVDKRRPKWSELS